ncbi:hypothetical protein DFQ28_003381 [Apophysomyces sp. BC1034]|nr:hypothetical protein DFQ30_006353 [Apophysomyces sp. BC1015]KAG0180699.1 hypothetical protein DFQ29_000156 [Apophysomyces sp. BC1021]KAG0189453.1 hypothetical protein DFQ28_003381 [Apophysomyces sp. BC1034]
MGEHKRSKKPKKEKKEKKHKKSSKQDHSESEPEIDYSDPSLWVEKSDNDAPAAQPQVPEAAVQQPQQGSARHGWMLDESMDFGSFGTARAKPETFKPHPDEIKVSHRELNIHLKSGLHVDQYPEIQKPAIKFGDAGSAWRMMKLKRIVEQAETDGRPLEEVALERYGSSEKFKEAMEEREYLDNRKRRGNDSRRRDDRDERSSSRRFMFTDTDTSQKAFRRPTERRKDLDEFGREVKRRRRSASPDQAAAAKLQAAAAKLAEAAAEAATDDQVRTPVIITQHELPQAFSAEPALSRDELNKLNAKLVKAKLMGADNVDELEKEYEIQAQRYEAAQTGAVMQPTENGKAVAILPTVDRDGRLYDFALSKPSDTGKVKGKQRYKDTHDPVTGERLRYGTSDDKMTLLDMIRQEKAGSKMASNMDLEFANRIMTDATFENNLDYMDEKADVMAAKKGVSEEQKMRYAVSDYKRTQQALEKCRFCYHDSEPPQCAMISLGTQTYLALPNVQELTPGHCLIVPLQHVTSMLECDDDVWSEVRNFQKCLLQMYNDQGCGVVFMETVTNLRSHRHTVIEAIPIPYNVYEDSPAYFKEAIMGVEEEWTQHKKLIETSSRGFRNSMVKNLPYFHVWCGLDEGYGHVIENGKEFPYWFGKEVIAGMLDIGPERWRRPKYHHQSENRTRQLAFLKSWEKWDWTSALDS